MEPSDLYAPRSSPEFSLVLTYWQVIIARNRWLRQKVVVYDIESPYHDQVLWFWAKLSRQEMAAIEEIIERIGFRDYLQGFGHQTMHVTDCPSYTLSVRFGKWVKEVKAYDMPHVAEFEQQPEVIGCQELWEAIMARAPFQKVPIEQGLPLPWWRL